MHVPVTREYVGGVGLAVAYDLGGRSPPNLLVVLFRVRLEGQHRRAQASPLAAPSVVGDGLTGARRVL